MPQIILNMWNMDINDGVLIMARRFGSLFLGLGVMLYFARNIYDINAQKAIASAIVVSCSALAICGIYEFINSRVSAYIFIAIIIEIIFAIIMFLGAFLNGRIFKRAE